MKKMFKNLLVVMCALVMGTTAFGKTLYVASEIAFPPFEFFDKKEIVGFDIDLINEVAKRNGMDVKIQNMNFDALLPALQMKKVDIVVSGMTITEERKKSVNFSQPYFTAKQVLIVKEGSTIKAIEDLKGKKVAAGLGYTGDIMLTKMGDVNLLRVTDPNAGLMQVQTDKVVAMIFDFAPAKNYVANNKGLKIVEIVADEEQYGFAMRKEDKELLANVDKALTAIKADGTYDKLVAKWFK